MKIYDAPCTVASASTVPTTVIPTGVLNDVYNLLTFVYGGYRVLSAGIHPSIQADA